MIYQSEWKADDEGPGGLAIFVVEGTRREFRLESFTHFLGVGNMLEAAFNQGKSFALSRQSQTPELSRTAAGKHKPC